MIDVYMTDEGPKRIEDLTREEMIACIHDLARTHRDFYSPRNIKARAYGSVELMKRGEYA